MKVTFLEAKVPLTKTFYMKDGQIEKAGHPKILNYTSHTSEISTIEELHELFLSHAEKGHCFLKGNVSRPLIDEPRAGTTDPNAPTRILLLDLDGIKGIKDLEDFLTHIGLQGVDYIAQYSSSMGVIPSRGTSAHIAILLSKEYAPAVLKQYLMRWNMTIPILRENMGLTKTYNALRWALDVTTCQNDKLIYIAPPLLKDGVVDSFEGERITLVKKTNRTAQLPEPFPNAAQNQDMQEGLLNSLRANLGLKPRPKDKYKSAGPVEYLVHPDRAVVTGVKADANFTYLNLNNGDSWGYYHPTNNPKFIRNFKGEPTYLTSELVPEYWAQVREKMAEAKPDENGDIYLAFRDFRTAQYYNGMYNGKTGRLDLAIAKNETQLKHFLAQHDQPYGDFVPDWNVRFDPHSSIIVDSDNRVINTYQPSAYMRMKPIRIKDVPPTIRKVIFHAIGEDEEVFEHLMNSLAVIVQYKTRTGTAWVLHGVPGTGKGLFLNNILRPIMGSDYVITKRMRELDSNFNGYMEKAFVMWVDEAEQSDFQDKGIMNADLKNFITEPRISIRKMYTLPYEVDNYMTWFLASNKGHIIRLDPGDRRYNVCAFQDKRLEITEAEVRQIEDELYEFYSYLATRTADKDLARIPLNNAAKHKMTQLNRTTLDKAADAIISGDLSFFEDHAPQTDVELLPRYAQERAEAYIKLLAFIRKEQPASILREELHLLLDYAVGDMPEKQAKFTTMIKHHGLDITTITRGGKSYRGMKVKWKIEAKES